MKHLVVIGGGAAGFFCAVNATRLHPSLKVILLEKSGKLLSKVKISGGGRCNVTHACFEIDKMSRQYPRGANFVKKTFHQFFTPDTIQWFESRGVKLKTETDGRMFPVSNSSQTIIDCLLKEAEKYNVGITLKAEVEKVTIQNSLFTIHLSGGKKFNADFVCIACGGYPKSQMFDWIRDLGHTIEEPVPSLFTFNLPGHPVTKLMGVSIEKVKVKISGTRLEQEGPLLVTHWGLSGPVILRLSAWGARELKVRNWEFGISINWLPGYNEQSMREKFRLLRSSLAAQKVINKNHFGLPQRLWEYLAGTSGINNTIRWAGLSAGHQHKFIQQLLVFNLQVKGKTTFKEEFVTAGGVKLNEIDPNNMMSKKIPGLFFAGEIMDVDGITGGYNFQHAWTSGYIAANSLPIS